MFCICLTLVAVEVLLTKLFDIMFVLSAMDVKRTLEIFVANVVTISVACLFSRIRVVRVVEFTVSLAVNSLTINIDNI